MRLRRALFPILVLLLLAGAKSRSVRQPYHWTATPPPIDRFTSSEPEKIRTTHVSLDLTVDFQQRRLRGFATLTLVSRGSADELILDTASLDITRVLVDGAPATYRYGTANDFGTPLHIEITPATRHVTIEYSTNPNAGGLNWNTAAQSYGRVQPYLYTLSEPTDARSWIPIQDTPSVRMTYDATIRVPQGMLAVMSAGDNPRATSPDGVYRFSMYQPIPAYLIALAVGRLEYHAFDERTSVYAEPELMDAAKHELQYLPGMLDAAERIAGPHPYPVHNVVLMPPTFVVGGMEHPMINFVHPFSAVSGNHPANPEPKSLLAHELAHSWAGDSTTLATWDDVWLNEGITSYLTLRILEEMGEDERVELQYYLDRRAYESLLRNTQDPSWSILHHAVTVPWEGFGSTGYTKGELFIRTLEDTLGRATLDAFLRSYFAKHNARWASDESFLAELRHIAGDEAVSAALVHEWIYSPGLPSNLSATTTSAINSRVQSRAVSFASGASLTSLAPQTWTDVEVDRFLQSISRTTFRNRASEIDAAFGLSLRNTPPLQFLLHAIGTDYAPASAAIERALMRGGSNSTIITLYSALAETSAGRARAAEIFSRARDRYHSSVVVRVQQILSSAAAATADAA